MSIFTDLETQTLMDMLAYCNIQDKIIFKLETGQFLSLIKLDRSQFTFAIVSKRTKTGLRVRNLNKILSKHTDIAPSFRLQDGTPLTLGELSRVGTPNQFGEPIYKFVFNTPRPSCLPLP